MIGKSIKIEGTGVYLPEAKSSETIEKMLGIPLGWSEKYSGVKNRHHVTFETNGFMGARAAEQALQSADLTLRDIDMLISAGSSYDYPLPNQASVIKHELRGASFDFPAIDIDSTCLSFISGLEMAASILDGQTYKRILLVSTEVASKGLDPSNWETATLFGDGAAATIIAYDPFEESLVVKSQQKTYSEGVYHTIIEGGGIANYFNNTGINSKDIFFRMQGKNLLRLAKKKLPIFIKDFFDDLPIKIEDVDVIIPHQASSTGLAVFKKMYPFNESQVIDTLAMNGNCIAASIPLTLHHVITQKKLKRGQICLLIGTSAGFSIGGLLFRY
ncbi:3-oxoacyl-[acyl-carrier-protein] synthase III C-terminal domain-containing protein [Flavivirga algicola]|uniref:Beta-ketoacyl-ACP synthase III n=1 Tax=Flavivirga algicola TaxID=2729136 RepID=A0ABX1RSL4_9FLAO|nr:3-oxoacyl-[acyl-carrier-protein] synthase III C-terminal domain-containing protein [Flavivirga algicola]NMH86536.1 beta-ketoacyl-ACP synthase III [Flavivirga algicola]